MYKVLFSIIGLISGLAYSVAAQETDADTLILKEIEIVGIDNDFFQVAGEQLTLKDSIGSASLTELIENNSPVYFIQYGGKGQLSAINLRGLGGSRTNLVWNGMEINSFTLGQSDFNLLNGASGEISIQRGGSSALFGNGAIGGVVSINSAKNQLQGQSIGITQGFGSFGEFNTSVDYQYSNNKFQLSSKLYFLSIENNFSYDFREDEIAQTNAAYLNRGFTQHVGYWINPSNLISLDFWYNHNDREIQPNKGDLTNQDFLIDTNKRLMVSWSSSKKNLLTEAKVGYSHDDQNFNDNSRVQVKRTFFSYQSGGKISSKLSFKTGVSANYLTAITQNYDGEIDELRTDLFASVKWNPIKKLVFGVNLREPLINDQLQPFTPSVALEYKIEQVSKGNLSLDLQLSRSYRIPTFNDRYWNPGGNLDLLPELSRNLEGGFNWQGKLTSELKMGIASRYYYHDVDDWIIWRPGGSEIDDNGDRISFWFPDNIRQVIAQGIENEISLEYVMPDRKSIFSFNYNSSFTSARNKKVLSDFDRSLDKQLPYTPRWINLFRTSLSINGWGMTLINRIVSERYTETNNELPPLEAYHVANIAIAKKWTKERLSYLLNISINNIGNTEYENFSNRAMPLRNYGMNFKINYNFLK